MNRKQKKKLSIFKIGVVIVCAALISGISIAAVTNANKDQNNKKEVITISTLEKIINVSELSTLMAVYNGVAQVMNEENPDEIDYYASYEATVKAGIDFDKVTISVDNSEKTIKITLPEVHITDINVDIASLDYIFINDAANNSTVSKDAFKACEEDVKKESEQQGKIIELAKQNAENTLTALIRPFIEQLDTEFTLIIA